MSIEQGLTAQQRMAMLKGYGQLLLCWDWELSGTLTFSMEYGDITFDRAEAMVKRYLRRMGRAENMALAGAFALCRYRGRVHVHFLLLGRGRRGRTSRTLRDVDPHEWERRWLAIAKIEPVNSKEGSAKYLAAQFLKNSACEIYTYDDGILVSTKIEPDPGIPIGSAEDLARFASLDEE